MEAIKVNLEIRERWLPMGETRIVPGATSSRNPWRPALMAAAAVLVLLAGFFGFSNRTMAMKFSEGDVDIRLSNDGTAYSHGVNGTWVSPANWAPGDELTARLFIRNDGPEDAAQAFFDWTNPVYGEPNLLDKVEVISWSESADGYSADRLSAYKSLCDSNGDGCVTVMELVNAGSFPLGTELADTSTNNRPSDKHTHAVLPANGQPYVIEMSFRFMEDAGNEYQDTTGAFDLRVIMVGVESSGEDDSSEDH